MKKIIQNTSLLVCAGALVVFLVLVLVNNTPIEINLPHFTSEELSEQKKIAGQK